MIADGATVIVALGGFFTGLAFLVTALGTLRLAVKSHRKLGEIDRAVNGKPPGSATMVSQVQDLYTEAFPTPQPEAIVPMLRTILSHLEAADVPPTDKKEG